MIIQVIGSRGMLGQAVCGALQRAGHTVHANGVDITHVYRSLITGEVVINCAGIVKGRKDISDSQLIWVNAYGPHKLAEACDEARVKLIHVSTDCVFNDHRAMSRTERTTPTPEGIYAMSKLLGEVIRWPHLTIRTSFIGWGKHGLLAELYANRVSTRIEYAGQRWSGHTVQTVSDILVILSERADIHGLLHVPGEFQTRAELIRRLSWRFNLDITVNESFEQPGYDRRLTSERWIEMSLPVIDSFNTQLERMPNEPTD